MAESYPPLAGVPQSVRIRWYRSPVDREVLKGLVERSDLKGALQAVGHLALAAVTGTLVYRLYAHQVWVGFAAALFCHGTVCSFFMLAGHELGHGTVFRTKWLNRLFLVVYSLLSWHNYHDFAVSHTYHHRYTLHPEADREVELPKTPSLRALYLLQLFTINLFGGFESQPLLPAVRLTLRNALRRPFLHPWPEDLYEAHPEFRAKSVRFSRITLLFHAVVLGVSIATGYWLIGVLVSCSFCVANWLRYLVGVPMHCGLRDNVADFRKCVRTIRLDPVSEFLYWRMNWHMEHHMYAGVPCYHLGKLHAAIKSDVPECRSLLGAWREMRAVWKRQQVEPGYQFDTPLPRGAGLPGDAGRQETDDLGSSIADLALHEAR